MESHTIASLSDRIGGSSIELAFSAADRTYFEAGIVGADCADMKIPQHRCYFVRRTKPRRFKGPRVDDGSSFRRLESVIPAPPSGPYQQHVTGLDLKTLIDRAVLKVSGFDWVRSAVIDPPSSCLAPGTHIEEREAPNESVVGPVMDAMLCGVDAPVPTMARMLNVSESIPLA